MKLGDAKLWIVRVEMTVQPEDFPSGDTVGFTNIVTWASDAEGASSKIREYVARYDWHVLGVEQVNSVDESLSYSDEMNDMIDRARDNPQAILLGTFHSYRVN